MDDQKFKELVLNEIKEAKAFRKNIKDALKKALYGDFDAPRIALGEAFSPTKQYNSKVGEEHTITR